MASFIKSKVQQSLCFLLMLVIAFSAFSGILFVNPSPSYAFDEAVLFRAMNVNGRKQLSNADLSEANLTNLNLIGSNLSGANLSGAYLFSTHLERADLSGANLTGAKLTSTNLTGAKLTGANLSKAIADSKTKFPDGFDAKGAGVIFTGY